MCFRLWKSLTVLIPSNMLCPSKTGFRLQKVLTVLIPSSMSAKNGLPVSIEGVNGTISE